MELFSSSSSDSEFEVLTSKVSSNSSSSNQSIKNQSNIKTNNFSLNYQNEIEKIIGINHPSFDIPSNTLMFYVKFKNQSYRSCKWISKDKLCESQRGTNLYKSFIKNPTPFRPVPLTNTYFSSIKSGNQSRYIYRDNEYTLYKPTIIEFDRGFITPERVISIQKKIGRTEYLIKWVSLDIIESTWETSAPQDLIDEYLVNNENTHARCYNDRNNKKTRHFTEIKESPIFKNDHKLADYQITCLNWLQNCWFQHRNSILADEMGLGKTIESISFLFILSKLYTFWGPFLVVCPKSTVTNWIDEFEQWTDFRVVNLTGDEKTREIIKNNLIYQNDIDQNKINMDKIIFDVLIISYDTLMNEKAFLRKFQFMYMIIDEAHKLKNFKSKTYENCASIQSYHTLLMTGTPIQNDISEIWSLLHFISPQKFVNYEEFDMQYHNVESPETIEKIHELLQPYLLRRKKNEVNIGLPEKEETIIEVEMTQIQRTLSSIIIQDNREFLTDVLPSKINLNNIMMQLRKLFCHPYLFSEFEPLCISQYKKTKNIPDSQELTNEDQMDSLILASGKTILIDKLLPKLKQGNHKVLIFSQMTLMLDILQDYLDYRRYNYERLDGSCSSASRSKSIENFQNNDNVFVFLLSTRAGGLGINLTKADTVIIYDCDWNPQNDVQALSRCYRFGQTKKVNVYRLITRGSYESEMFKRASKKLALDFAVLDTVTNTSNSALMSNSSSLNSLDEKSGSDAENPNNEGRIWTGDSKLISRKELEKILKGGTMEILNDNSNEIEKFCLENIDQILEKRSHTREDYISGGNSRFSKVTFDAGNEQEEDDKDFWKNFFGENGKNDDLYDLDSGIKTRPKKNINYAEKKFQKKGDGENEEEEVDDESSSSDNDFDFVPSQSLDDPNENLIKKTNNNSKSYQSNSNSNENLYQNSNNFLNSNQYQNTNMNSHANQFLIKNQFKNLNSTRNANSTSKANKSLSIKQNANSNQNPNDDRIDIYLPKSDKSIFLSSFKGTLHSNIYYYAIHNISRHGIIGSRLFVNKFTQEIGKSLISLAYLRLPKEKQALFSKYIDEYISDPYKQIFKTQFSELNDSRFISSLFKGKEELIISQAYNFDILYKAAVFISNGKLPSKFQFAPEMQTPIGWTEADDFVLISSSPFMLKVADIITDSKLPYSMINKKIRPPDSWFLERLELIVREVTITIPKSFRVYKQEIPNMNASKEKSNSINQINNNGNSSINSNNNSNNNNIISSNSSIIINNNSNNIVNNNNNNNGINNNNSNSINNINNSIHKNSINSNSNNIINKNNNNIGINNNNSNSINSINNIINKNSITSIGNNNTQGNNNSNSMNNSNNNINNSNDIGYNSGDVDLDNAELLYIKNFKSFSSLNRHVIYPTRLSKNFQKKLLRIFYLYGLPQSDAIQKIKTILRNENIKDELIFNFAIKFLIRAMKYEPDLCDLLKSLPRFDYSIIQNNKNVDIRWIKEEAIQAVASNMSILQKVRRKYNYFQNLLSSSANRLNMFQQLKIWNEIKINNFIWDGNYDIILFNTTAYYGFLFNSMLAYQIHPLNINKETIEEWREKEAFELAPYCHPCADMMKQVFSFEMKKKRIKTILDVIDKFQNQAEQS